MFICPLRGKRRRPQLVMQSDGASVVGPWEASWAAAGVPDNEEGKQEVLRKGTDMAGDEHDFEGRSRAAQAKAAHALDRLLKLAETRDSGQIRRVARFIAALYNGDAYPLDLFELRAVDVAISDDVINCIDALRWGRADLYKLVPDGQKRIEAVIRDWGVAPPEPLVPRDCADLNARLVTYGDAPGYRDVTLRFECEEIPQKEGAAKFNLELHVDARSAADIVDHVIRVHRFAWSRPGGGRPLDASDGEVAPRWARNP